MQLLTIGNFFCYCDVFQCPVLHKRQHTGGMGFNYYIGDVAQSFPTYNKSTIRLLTHLGKIWKTLYPFPHTTNLQMTTLKTCRQNIIDLLKVYFLIKLITLWQEEKWLIKSFHILTKMCSKPTSSNVLYVGKG